MLTRPSPGGGWVATHEDITERRRAEQRIAHMARHDSLTDLPNRLLFRERLSEALTRVPRGDRVALLYLDLDLFKNVNDTLGHQIGDELLKQVADRLRKSIRNGDTVARVGGDEFAIVQTNLKRPAETATLARRICDVLKSPFQLDGHTVVIDTSVGIALAPSDGTEPDELLKNADMALYGAKSDGRGSFRFFERDMDARMKERRALELALRHSLSAGEFEIHYQPIVDLEHGRIVCLEALLRWNHPQRGPLSPAEFIPIAEEIGLVVPIGEWVLHKACAEAAKWPMDVRIAVNLSPTQVMHGSMVPTIASALDAAKLPARRLEIEITETVFMHHADTTLAALHRLRDSGVKISLDDFGTGYSSLSYLRSFPFDKIKIDQSFVADLSDNGESIAIVRAIVGLAGNLKMRTTAEGVETSEQLAFVRALGCSEAQGFLLGHPRRADEVARLFAPAKIANALTAA
jgi:diguanylate cyclase (GGDEF)-like protein